MLILSLPLYFSKLVVVLLFVRYFPCVPVATRCQ